MGRSLQGLILALLLAAPVRAQECQQRELSSKPFYVPTGMLCQVGEEKKTCYTLEEFKKLLEVDHDLYTEKEKSKEKDSIISNQGLLLQQKDLVIEFLEKDKKVLDGQVTRLGEKWQTCLDENEGFPWDTMFWGVGAGVVVGIVAGVVTYLALSVPDHAD